MSIPYIKDSWRAGISDEYTRGVRGSFKYAYGVDINKRRDSLSCNWAMSNIANSSVVTDLPRFAVTSVDGSTYAFGSGGKIYSIAGDPKDPVISNIYTDTNGEIRGAAEWEGSDGINYMYWATATSIARKKMRYKSNGIDNGGFAGWTDATINYKTLLDNHQWHTMKIANGSLVIANGNYLATIDYDGSFNPAAMNIRPGNSVKCLEERDDYIIVGSTRDDESEEGYIWTWIVGDASWVQKKKIPVKGVNALIDTERLLMQGGAEGELFYSDFQNAAPLNSIDTGGKCNPRVDILNDLALFGMHGGTNAERVGIYSYGRRMLNRPFAMNNQFRLTRTVAGSTVGEIGAVWVASSAIFASWLTLDGSTTEYGIDMASSSTRATARLEGLEFTGGQPHLKKLYETEKIICEPLPASTGISLLYKKDRNTTGGDSSAGAGWTYAKIADGTGTTYSVTDSTEAEFIVGQRAKEFEIAVELTPSGSDTPEITGMVGYINESTSKY